MCRSAVLAGRVVDTLGRPGNLQRGEKKQIPLRAGQNVRGGREDRVEGLVAPHPGQGEIGPVNAALILALANDADLGLGAPLPAGTLRVYDLGHSRAGDKGNTSNVSVIAYDETAWHILRRHQIGSE